jgi:protein ImuB
MTVACVAVPRLALLAAGGGRRELLRGTVALAPEPGGIQVLGETSGAAQAQGVRSGMRLGEALARCPRLRLLSPDPERTAALWEEVTQKLEGIGAAVESERSGEAFFSVDGLRGLHGGVEDVIAAARRAVPMPVRVGVAPTRFAAYAVAASPCGVPRCGKQGGPIVRPADLRRFLGSRPLSIMVPRLSPPQPPADELVLTLSRLGIRSLGALAALSPADIADRFGPLGVRAHELARGIEEPLRPRRPREELAAELELPGACGGEQLDRALRFLVDRLLASPRRRRRTILSLRLGARLAGGGSWWEDLVLSRPSASAKAMHEILSLKLARLPAPADSLTLHATSLGPAGGDQLELSRRGDEQRRARLAEATRQVRAVQGPEALLKVLDVDPASHVPERRAALTSF